MQETITRNLKERYTVALRDYLAGGGEAALQEAYELGRRAIQDEVGVLDLVVLHQEAVETILRERRLPETCLVEITASER